MTSESDLDEVSDSERANNVDAQRGFIGFFAHNPVAANLLMLFVLILGLVTYFTIQRQMFPNIEINKISINIIYPGASPQEIEESVIVKIEDALDDIPELEKVVSRASRGSGSVILDVDVDAELANALDKVTSRVDAIANLPAEMEPLVVSQIEFQQQAIEMALAGNYSLRELKRVGNSLKDELLALPEVSLVSVQAPDDEIAIEVDPDTLRKYGLTISDVTQAINAYSTNASAGQLRTDTGLISVRVENQNYRGNEFAQIPVVIGEAGERVLLGEIATISDAFVEGEYYFELDGESAVYIQVMATKDQDLNKVVGAVEKWKANRASTLPPGMNLERVVDFTFYLDARLNMMLKNLLMGAILVALVLSVFLRVKLAFWVMVGLPVCFLGALMMMPLFDITINVVSLFAFIMVLGIVVDDAIVIGESVYTQVSHHGGGVKNVVIGARRVAMPATFGVLTTIAFFAPFTFATGPQSAFFVGIAAVSIFCLVFSLIESKLILPAHLANTHFHNTSMPRWQERFHHWFDQLIHTKYRKFLTLCSAWRWTVLASFIGILLVSVALVKVGLVRFVAQPSVPHDFPSIKIEMNDNASDAALADSLKIIETLVLDIDQQIENEYGQSMVDKMMVFNQGRSTGQVFVPLVPDDERVMNAFELARRWREATPELPSVKSITVSDNILDNPNDDSGDLGYLIVGEDLASLNRAGLDLMRELRALPGVYDVGSTIDPVGKEIQMQLKPVAYELGLSLSSIAAQVGVSFFGEEAQRIVRSGEELRVMVRYPEATRKSIASLKHTLIATPGGDSVMLGDVVEFFEVRGVSYVRREAGARSVYVSADIDTENVEPREVEKALKQGALPALEAQYPELSFELAGNVLEQREQQDEQLVFFVAALLIVYVLLAIPLKSYGQPLIVISIIPFSLTGAIWGHLFIGLDLSAMSTFGLVAAAGVVINDSLVMTHYVNGLRSEGQTIMSAVIDAGCARFRAITLTSITTFAGVLPIMFESSTQAQFVIPMAVALGFSVLFATVITLVLVPCLYLILEDIALLFRRLFRRTSIQIADLRQH